MPAFEVGNKEPYFFSEKYIEKYTEKYGKMTASEITLAAFEYPGVILPNNLVFVDPHDFIVSATNLAYLYVRHQRNIKNENIRVLNIDPG